MSVVVVVNTQNREYRWNGKRNKARNQAIVLFRAGIYNNVDWYFRYIGRKKLCAV